MTGTHLTLERRDEPDQTKSLSVKDSSVTLVLTPPVSEDYWSYRVRFNDRQALIAFPKFDTFGIGFAREEDWNTNLPYTCHTLEIVSHIWHNVDSEKPASEDGFDPDDNITILDVFAAVEAIQQAIARDHPDKSPPNSQAVFWPTTVDGP